MRLVWVGIFCLLPACRTRPFEAAQDGGSRDAALSDLAASDQSQICSNHQLEIVPLAGIGILDSDWVDQRAIRARVDVRLREGCDHLGRIDVQSMVGNATDVYVITAHA